jgi:hypothetical protein
LKSNSAQAIKPCHSIIPAQNSKKTFPAFHYR